MGRRHISWRGHQRSALAFRLAHRFEYREWHTTAAAAATALQTAATHASASVHAGTGRKAAVLCSRIGLDIHRGDKLSEPPVDGQNRGPLASRQNSVVEVVDGMASRRRFAEDFLRQALHRVIPVDQLQRRVQTFRRCIERELLRGDILPESTSHLSGEELRCDDHSRICEHVENGRSPILTENRCQAGRSIENHFHRLRSSRTILTGSSAFFGTAGAEVRSRSITAWRIRRDSSSGI